MLRIEVWGGAGEHGRSCYYIESGDQAILLDCGGKKQAREMYPKLNPEKVRKLNAVFLSHAHEDHCAGLPLLYKHGYAGEVWMTRPTSRQLADFLSSWGQYAAQQTEGELADRDTYDRQAKKINKRLLEKAGGPGDWIQIQPELKVVYGASGHLAGAVWLLIQLGEHLLFYSGDYGGESRLLSATLPVLHGLPPIDLAIIDAAYSDDEKMQETCAAQIIEMCRQTIAQGGKVWLPVPMHGRGHELAHLLMEAFESDWLPFYCDEKLAAAFADLIMDTSWFHAESYAQLEASWKARMRVLDRESLQQSLASEEPAIYLLTDPMLQKPATEACVQAFKRHAAGAIIWTGHVYPGTKAAELLNMEMPIQLVQCRFKVHQGMPDVKRMLDHLKPKRSLLVHADHASIGRLQRKLEAEGWRQLYSLHQGDSLEIE
ncbi:hypothetical protein XYCOK13_24980 [Xylanibacillus composti]|uniref:Metallo-beta-lactamase domain-containing protein n=1 Tax=Xylanibacillus composti TaxID=1572762 RepID=A0A8J4H2H1_9BACL|nr:MBL fold metallo-hydrolase [Xylanibacillus composti]GIQ69674.1 hypothetical protein XYCOK13_24980 [Xylanibacillus composti]